MIYNIIMAEFYVFFTELRRICFAAAFACDVRKNVSGVGRVWE